MNILLQVYNLEVGGTQKYVIDLANSFAQQGHTVHIITSVNNTSSHRFIIDERIFVKVIPHNKNYINCLKSYLINTRIDIVHSSDWELWKYCWFLCNRMNISFVKTTHATPKYSLLNVFKFYLNPKNLKFVFNLIFYKLNIIDISNIANKSSIKLFGSFVNTKVIYLGVEEGEFKIRQNNNFKLLWAGSLSTRKQPLFAIEIFKNLVNNDNNFHLDMYGNGPLNELVLENSNIKNLSVINDKVLSNDLISEYDLTLLTSLDEGTPYIIFQSLASGIPVITTQCGAIEEIIISEKNGYIISNNNPIDFCAYIYDTLYKKEKYMSLSNSAFKCYNDKYRLERMVNETFDFYLDILQNR